MSSDFLASKPRLKRDIKRRIRHGSWRWEVAEDDFMAIVQDALTNDKLLCVMPRGCKVLESGLHEP